MWPGGGSVGSNPGVCSEQQIRSCHHKVRRVLSSCPPVLATANHLHLLLKHQPPTTSSSAINLIFAFLPPRCQPQRTQIAAFHLLSMSKPSQSFVSDSISKCTVLQCICSTFHSQLPLSPNQTLLSTVISTPSLSLLLRLFKQDDAETGRQSDSVALGCSCIVVVKTASSWRNDDCSLCAPVSAARLLQALPSVNTSGCAFRVERDKLTVREVASKRSHTSLAIVDAT